MRLLADSVISTTINLNGNPNDLTWEEQRALLSGIKFEGLQIEGTPIEVLPWYSKDVKGFQTPEYGLMVVYGNNRQIISPEVAEAYLQENNSSSK